VTLYVETSAVLCWLFGESAASEVRDLLDQADRIVTSTLTILETERTLNRGVSGGALTEADGALLRGAFARESATWDLMEITPDVRRRAGKPFPVEPIRSLDAIHLATALILVEGFGPMTVMSFDERIDRNIVPLGLLRPPLEPGV
jgi:predicted nucleic acid-binding protein